MAPRAAPTAPTGRSASFDITRPAVTDNPPDYAVDGSYHHRGVEGSVAHTLGPWTVDAGAMALDAQREGAADLALNGQRPVNVPKYTARLQARYRVAALPGLDVQAGWIHEGRPRRAAGRQRADPGVDPLRPRHALCDEVGRRHHLTWRVGVDNLFDRRAWRESPYQYGHVYLFPLERAHLPRVSVRSRVLTFQARKSTAILRGFAIPR